jgi:hypothetical protein
MRRFLAVAALLTLCASTQTRAQCDPPLNPIDDGSGANGAVGLPAVVISEINPGDYIELFNTTGSDFNTSSYWFCSPFLSSAVGAVVVPAGGYATVAWPVVFGDTDAGGEIILYKSSVFGLSTDILDFVCWGTNPHGSRLNQALSVGKWTGVCADAIPAGDAIHRHEGSAGTSAGDYIFDIGSPSNCVPTAAGSPPLAITRLTNYPNPFSSSTRIELSLTSEETLDLAIYAVDGRRVRALRQGAFPGGETFLSWDGRDDRGVAVPSGVYFLRADGRASQAVARLIHVR